MSAFSSYIILTNIYLFIFPELTCEYDSNFIIDSINKEGHCQKCGKYQLYSHGIRNKSREHLTFSFVENFKWRQKYSSNIIVGIES